MQKFMKVLAFSIIFSALLTVIAGTSVLANETDNESLPMFESIIKDSLNLNSNKTLEPNDFSVAPSSNTNDLNLEDTTNASVLKATSISEGGLTEVKTIIPYKIDEDGTLVNSFEYASRFQQITPSAISEVPTTFVDVTITTLTYYAHYFSLENVANFYRHAGIEAYWDSNNSSVDVSHMLVNYETSGDLYAYPDVINQPMENAKIQNDYYIKSSINRYSPVEGRTYIDGNNTMPYNRVVYLTDYFNHGGLVYIKLDYTVDGNYRTDERSYYVYSK